MMGLRRPRARREIGRAARAVLCCDGGSTPGASGAARRHPRRWCRVALRWARPSRLMMLQPRAPKLPSWARPPLVQRNPRPRPGRRCPSLRPRWLLSLRPSIWPSRRRSRGGYSRRAVTSAPAPAAASGCTPLRWCSLNKLSFRPRRLSASAPAATGHNCGSSKSFYSVD